MIQATVYKIVYEQPSYLYAYMMCALCSFLEDEIVSSTCPRPGKVMARYKTLYYAPLPVPLKGPKGLLKCTNVIPLKRLVYLEQLDVNFL